MTTVTLQRVVFPVDADVDIFPLYWDVDQAAFAAPASEAEEADGPRHVTSGTPNVDLLLDRRRVLVAAGTRASSATYFNAFPASYWRRWTTVGSVRLAVSVRGEGGRIMVYRSTADGRIQRFATRAFDAPHVEGDPASMTFELPLKAFGDGGWYWFDVIAGHDDVVLEKAHYEADVVADYEQPSMTISITTFNRPDWCVRLLDQLAPGVQAGLPVDRVLVVDQGNDRVSDQPGYAAVAEAMGPALRVIEQANVGGAGGFARGMMETLGAGESDFILLLDDDVEVELEGIRRAVVFGGLSRRPTIVGGQMLSMYSRASLHSFGEVVNRWRFFWGPADRVQTDHDFAVRSLRATPWMHRRVDVDYNGWWMCLIPVSVLREIGLALPAFIKWDDAEYGLRAGRHGFPTVTLPGVALWHVPWTDKDDALDWQAYYHQRNRFLAALLHSPYERGGRMVQESMNHQIKHIVSMQYSTAALRLMALEDLMSGPEHLHRDLEEKLDQIRKLRVDYPDAQAKPDPDAFPHPRRKKPLRRGQQPRPPHNWRATVQRAASGLLRQTRSMPSLAQQHPQEAVPARDAAWWRLANLDSAVVSTMDGTGAAWLRRDRGLAFQLLRRSLAVHERLLADWPALSARYGNHLTDIVSEGTWARTLRIDAITSSHQEF